MKENFSSKIPLNRAILYIFLSSIIVSGTGFMGWLYYLHLKEMRWNDEKFRILEIAHVCHGCEPLKTDYLAELLELSKDRPKHLYRFKVAKGEEKLLSSPLIKSAEFKKTPPFTLTIFYERRQPIARVADFENGAVDEEGILMPYSPYFDLPDLPILYFGIKTKQFRWGNRLPIEKLSVAKDLIKQTKDLNFSMTKIDLSMTFADSYGQREIVLQLKKEKNETAVLRLNSNNYSKNLKQFKILANYLEGYKKPFPWIIDMRIGQLAFLRN